MTVPGITRNDAQRGGIDQVAAALRLPRTTVTRIAARTWNLQFKNGRHRAATAALSSDDDWLILNAPCAKGCDAGELDSPQLADLLRQNVLLPGGLKYTIPLGATSPIIAADLPLDEAVDNRSEIAATCGELRRLLTGKRPRRPRQRLQELAGDEPAEPAIEDDVPQVATAGLGTADRVAELCADAGWSCATRAGGQAVITLDVAGAFHQALATGTGEGRFRLTTELDSVGCPGLVCATAVQLFLLTAASVVRMVRPVCIGGLDAPKYGWEVAWHTFPSAFQLHHALAALSVACRHTAKEAQALGEETIAKHYLRRRGSASSEACSLF